MRPIAFTAALLSALLMSTSHAAAAGGWTWPVRGQVVSQFRNGDDPYAAGQHRGVDLAAPVGTPVVAATAGTIVYAGVVGSSGLTVAERTADGRYELSYLHLSAASVRRGQAVGAGTPIGAVGVTGRRSTAQPHLHFGVREAADRHAYVDPLRFLGPPPGESPSPRRVPAPVSLPVGAAPLPETVPALASEAAAGARPARGRVPGPSRAGASTPAHFGAPAPQPGAHASLPSARPADAPAPARA